MSQQRALFPEFVPVEDEHDSIADRFAEFHRLNPWVFRELERLAAEAISDGDTRIGVKHLVEVLRWRYRRGTDGSRWKYNNNWTSHYARLLLEAHPEWVEHIETRRLRA